MSWFDAALHWYSANATAINPMATFVGAVGAFATGVTLAWAALKNARIAARRHEEQTKADRQRRITESFSKATEQLASEKIEVRLGGIYTLERISRESRDDYWVVMETLTAFLREHTRWKEGNKISLPTLVEDENSEAHQPEPGTDIAAILRVIARRDDKDHQREMANNWTFDFGEIDLRGAYLADAHLEGANFSATHLEGAFLLKAYLDGAFMPKVHLDGAILDGACLDGAHLYGALLGRAHLEKVNLDGAHLEGADLGTAEGLVQDQIIRASGNSKTILPQGLTRPEHWTRVS